MFRRRRGDYKMIISKEEDLTEENLDKTLNSIRESSVLEKDGEYDELVIYYNMSYMNFY